ncbi:MAG: YbaB/EbfC family nucleoid-associated protein [Candidatus Edwardsbacteria bacterium]|nr:YbaB/EbfC family nucleoid-associated protein [Candidatus Edwardsbacteria bacterium]
MAKGYGDIMKQAQQMQTRMEQLQKELAAKRVEATVGGGMVMVAADGAQHIIEIRINPEVVKPEDAEMLQELVLLGVNEALKKSRETAAQEMSKLTGGMSLPGLF